MGWQDEELMLLYCRSEHLAAIDRLLEGMRSGRAGALVLRGEVGIGKSALLDTAEDKATGARVLRVTGVESEAELPFAALHALLRPALDHVAVLPERQAMALRGVFGIAETAVADRFLAGLATLSLVAELAEDRPVLCLVDDAQWLDRASRDVLMFAARRLCAERAAILVAARDDPLRASLPDLPELRVGRLDRASAEQLLAGTGLAAAAREQVIAEAAGNPLALIELSRGLSVDERAGSVTPLTVPAVSPAGRVQRAFLARISCLPEGPRLALLVAALAGLADLAQVSRAITACGGSLTDLAAAERAGLLRVTPTGVSFAHPLVRTAALASSDVADRMAGHRALAGVLDGDRRAWHLAALADGPDEQVAAALDDAAQRACQRGSRAAMSAAYERAAGLSAGQEARGRRLALAADAALDAGQLQRAQGLARQADGLVKDPAAAAALARLEALLSWEAGHPAEAAGVLLDGAELLGGADPVATRAMVMHAVLYLLRIGTGPANADLERRASALLPPAEARLLQFLAAIRRLQDGDIGTPITVPPRPSLRSLPVFAQFCLLPFDMLQGDVSAARSHAASLVGECRDAGMASSLGYALGHLAFAQALRGEFLDAMASADEGLRLTSDTGQTIVAREHGAMAAALTAMTGDEETRRTQAVLAQDLSAGGWARSFSGADYSLILLDLGCGRYECALNRTSELMARSGRHAPFQLYAYPDHVEAAIRAGQPDLAARPLAEFSSWADAIGQQWATAIAARCSALAAGDARAEPLYMRAIATHDGDGRPFEQARTRLLYGEWLRRNQRRADARKHLLDAASAFARMSARPWQERAESELRAAGAAATTVNVDDPLARLTPQELRVVRLAAAGASNKQIGAQLFLSPRTVGYHLYKAFPKLGVSTREELGRYAS
ncbi:MAG TPA: LuxR family transcriptional regulator [Streptosporangiaceae bacterium]|nr:LuxR family transcriptional regulator [Streptosporangiaceae bacterium]